MRYSVDAVENGFIYGWAFDKSCPECTTLTVVIDDASEVEVRADVYRQDLFNAGIGDGNVSFAARIPAQFRDGHQHNIKIKDDKGRLLWESNVLTDIALSVYEFRRLSPWIDGSDDDFKRELERLSTTIDEGTIENLRNFREHGFFHLRGVIRKDLIEILHDHVEMAWRETPPCYALNPMISVPDLLSNLVKQEDIRSLRNRILDFHNLSDAAAEIMCAKEIVKFISCYFQEQVTAMQSLLFEVGTEQGPHQDFPYVHTRNPGFLAGAWVPLEDISEEAGPLFYYPGSHRLIDTYEFEDGSVLAYGNGPHIQKYQNYLARRCQDINIKPVKFLPEVGDVLIWHSGLVHGGSIRKNPSLTRKSIVFHYSTVSAYPEDRRSPGRIPKVINRNGCRYYAWDHCDHIEGRYKCKVGR